MKVTINKKESEKDIREPFSSSGTNFRTSSKDNKQGSSNNLAVKNEIPPSVKKDKSMEKQMEIHVKKWVDYSTKYGLGYLLSDGSTGVYFNDSTKIIMDKNG